MRRELLAGVSAIALVIASASAATLFSDPADAADLRAPVRAAPPPIPAPVFSWTGCYVGAHVGWGWGNSHATETSSSFGSASSGIDTNGALFGGQVGCNYQFAGNWVVGVQGDFAGTDFNGRANDNFFGGDDATIALKTEWLASVTGRVGYAFWNNQVLVYAKGGGAWARNQWDVHDADLFFSNPIFSETRSGWTVGGGVEWTLWSPNWTAFVEYNFYDFNSGGTTLTQLCSCGSVSNTFVGGKQEINTVKVGVNYKFNWFGGGY
ncbi:MAG: outer membrane beta-barrel protein [Xanthobacteraceae bacterium]